MIVSVPKDCPGRIFDANGVELLYVVWADTETGDAVHLAKGEDGQKFIHERDGWRCLLCGCQAIEGDSNMAPTIGHIVPLKNPLNTTHGHVANNTFTNCASCNRKQGNAVVIDGHQNVADPRSHYIDYVRVWGYPFRERSGVPNSPACPPK